MRIRSSHLNTHRVHGSWTKYLVTKSRSSFISKCSLVEWKNRCHYTFLYYNVTRLLPHETEVIAILAVLKNESIIWRTLNCSSSCPGRSEHSSHSILCYFLALEGLSGGGDEYRTIHFCFPWVSEMPSIVCGKWNIKNSMAGVHMCSSKQSPWFGKMG